MVNYLVILLTAGGATEKIQVFLFVAAMIGARFLWDHFFGHTTIRHPKTGATYKMPRHFKDEAVRRREMFLFKIWQKEQDGR